MRGVNRKGVEGEGFGAIENGNGGSEAAFRRGGGGELGSGISVVMKKSRYAREGASGCQCCPHILEGKNKLTHLSIGFIKRVL